MDKTKLLLIINIVLLSLITTNCSQNEQTIKVGAVLPLTGDAAQAGRNTKQGIDLCLEQINSSGGIDGKKIEVIYEDCKGDPKEAVSSIQKLINIDKVPAVIDNSLSNVTLAMAPIANKNEVILLATGASSPKITNAGDYVFRIWNSDLLEGEVTAEFTNKELGINKISELVINNDYGLGLKEAFTKKFTDLGGKIISQEMFNPGDNDFKNQIAKVLQHDFEALYLVGYPTECSRIITQLKSLGFKGIIIGTVVMADPIIQKAIEETGYECYYPVPEQPDPTQPSVSDFINAYKKKYNQDPPMLADVGYDAIDIITNGILSTNTRVSGKAIKEYFYRMPKHNGASGTFSFNSNGDVRKAIKIIK